MGPFPASRPHKFQYLLTIKCTFTKWLEAFPLKVANAENVIRILTTEIFPRFGKYERLHSDMVTQFTSGQFKEMADIKKIQVTTTPPYNPKSNPVERSHRDLKAVLLALSAGKPHDWVAHIPHILFAFRNAVCASTGFTPFQLMFGRNPIEDLDTMLPSPARKRELLLVCLLYTSPSPRDKRQSRMPSSA